MLTLAKKLIFAKIEAWLLVLILIIGSCGTIAIAHFATKTAVGNNELGLMGKVAFGIARIPDIVEDSIRQALGYTNKYAVADAQYLEVLNEVKYHNRLPGYLTRRFKSGTEFELVNLSDGSVYKRWENLPYSPRTVSLYDDTLLMGGRAGKEQSARTIEKYNQQGERLWQVELFIHHTIFVDTNGFIYTPITFPEHKYAQSLMPVGSNYRDDGYAVLDPDGNILESKSVTQILIDNDLGHLIFGVGPLEEDAIHLNAVKVAEIKSEYWEIGDLLMSARHLSLVFLYRPSTGKVIWHQAGPWLNQHDPDFLNATQISIFGNDMASSFSNRTAEDAKYTDGGNKIYVYDFDTEETTTPYNEVMERTGLATVTAGSNHIFEDGSLFVWFSNSGLSMVYDAEADSISFLGYQHDDNRLDRVLTPRYLAEPLSPPGS